jgi:hypothetical protein
MLADRVCVEIALTQLAAGASRTLWNSKRRYFQLAAKTAVA